MTEDFWLESAAYWVTLLGVAVGFVFHAVTHRRERRQDETRRIEEARQEAAWKSEITRRVGDLERKMDQNRQKLTGIFASLDSISTRLARIEGSLNGREKQR